MRARLGHLLERGTPCPVLGLDVGIVQEGVLNEGVRAGVGIEGGESAFFKRGSVGRAGDVGFVACGLFTLRMHRAGGSEEERAGGDVTKDEGRMTNQGRMARATKGRGPREGFSC